MDQFVDISTRVYCKNCKYFTCDFIYPDGTRIKRSPVEYPYVNNHLLYDCISNGNIKRNQSIHPVMGETYYKEYISTPTKKNQDCHCQEYEEN